MTCIFMTMRDSIKSIGPRKRSLIMLLKEKITTDKYKSLKSV